MSINPKSLENLIPPKKGEVRNPNGKQKGTRNLSSVIQEVMFDEDFEVKLKNGDILKGAPSRKIAETMAKLAMKDGNTKAAEWLAKHGWGNKIVHDFEESLFTDAELTITLTKPKVVNDQPDAERETTSGT